MWIFCAGSKRSGSTLQYNIASRIVEIKEKGKRLPHRHPDDFNQVLSENEGCEKLKTFKTHILTPDIKEFISKSQNIKIIYCYRDVRDVNVSLVKKGWIKKNKQSLSNTTEQYVKDFQKWMTVKDLMYISKYENFYNDIEKEVIAIAQYLEVAITKAEVLQITQELNPENLKNSELDFEQKGKFNFDRKTLLHKDHIQGRTHEQYKSFFSKSEILAIEKVAYNWLSKYGYNLNWYHANFFFSYSQHADDYIAWQLLGKKRNGVVVEVGAFDGQHLSNSKSLEEQGWTSLCIEPTPESYKHLEANRPNAINLNLAVVGDNSIKKIDFYTEDLGVLSGCLVDEDDLKRRYNNRGIAYKSPEKIKVEAKTLNQILESQNLKSVDVMSIDVEGFELEVLKGIDLIKNDIKLLIIEANDDDIKNKILSIFKTHHHYIYAGNNYQNLFFVKQNALTKNAVRKLDYSNYIKAKQIHPKGVIFTIDSTVPNFKKSKDLIKFQKYLGLF